MAKECLCPSSRRGERVLVARRLAGTDGADLFLLAHPVIGSHSNALYILQTRPGSLVLLGENGASFPFPGAHHQPGTGAGFAWYPCRQELSLTQSPFSMEGLDANLC